MLKLNQQQKKRNEKIKSKNGKLKSIVTLTHDKSNSIQPVNIEKGNEYEYQ